jgi:hypothetical protein
MPRTGAPTKVYAIPTVATWTDIDLDDPAAPMPCPRAFHGMCRVHDFVFVVGGEGGAYGPEAEILSDVWRFDMQRLAWHQVKTTGEAPRLSRSACVLAGNGSTIVLCGGFDGMYYTSSVFGLDLRTSSWTRYELAGHVPEGGAINHSATMLPEGRILLVLTPAGARNSELFELMLHHTAKRAIFHRIAGRELKIELNEQRLKVGRCASGACGGAGVGCIARANDKCWWLAVGRQAGCGRRVARQNKPRRFTA